LTFAAFPGICVLLASPVRSGRDTQIPGLKKDQFRVLA
jgi:hypothetical protein